MIKVVHIISDTNIGGAGRYLLNLLKSRDRVNFQVKVVCPPQGLLAREIRALGVEVLPLPEGEKSFSLQSLRCLIRILRREKPHIAHTHASLAGRVGARLAGVPVIILTRHGIGEKVLSLKKRATSRLAARLFTDGVIAISRAVEEALLAQGVPRQMIRTIYNGIDLAECTGPVDAGRVRQEFALGDGPVIGVVARLTPEKGHRYFLGSVPMVLQAFPRAKFLLVGAGTIEKELRELVNDLQLEETVIFTGYREDVLAFIEAMDISVLPSVTEGLGLALLESMARSKPIVAANVGGIPEVVEDGVNGILVPPADPQALAEALISLLSDPALRKAMGERGRAILEEKFSAETMTAEIQDFYFELLRKKGVRL